MQSKPEEVLAYALRCLGQSSLTLAGIVGLAVQREASRLTAPAPVADHATPAAAVAEPVALSAAEEAYAQALWTIHSAAKVWAIDLDFAGLLYKTDGQDAGKLEAKVQALAGNFGCGRIRARAIDVPLSMRSVHDKYLAAIRLYKDAAAEMLKTAQDRDDRHLLVAQGMSQHAAEEMLRVGDVLWPGEYKPN